MGADCPLAIHPHCTRRATLARATWPSALAGRSCGGRGDLSRRCPLPLQEHRCRAAVRVPVRPQPQGAHGLPPTGEGRWAWLQEARRGGCSSGSKTGLELVEMRRNRASGVIKIKAWTATRFQPQPGSQACIANTTFHSVARVCRSWQRPGTGRVSPGQSRWQRRQRRLTRGRERHPRQPSRPPSS